MRVAIPILAFSIGVIASCSSTTGPLADADVELNFGIQRVATEPAFLVEPTEESLVVRGTYEAFTSGYTAEASADRSAGILELRVIGTQPAANYPAIVATGYEARVRGVLPGPLRIRVIHEYRGTSRPAVLVFEHDLRVQ